MEYNCSSFYDSLFPLLVFMIFCFGITSTTTTNHHSVEKQNLISFRFFFCRHVLKNGIEISYLFFLEKCYAIRCASDFLFILLSFY